MMMKYMYLLYFQSHCWREVSPHRLVYALTLYSHYSQGLRDVTPPLPGYHGNRCTIFVTVCAPKPSVRDDVPVPDKQRRSQIPINWATKTGSNRYSETSVEDGAARYSEEENCDLATVAKHDPAIQQSGSRQGKQISPVVIKQKNLRAKFLRQLSAEETRGLHGRSIIHTGKAYLVPTDSQQDVGVGYHFIMFITMELEAGTRTSCMYYIVLVHIFCVSVCMGQCKPPRYMRYPARI